MKGPCEPIAGPDSPTTQGNDPSLAGKKFWVPVYTGQDLCTALQDQAPYTLPTGGNCGAAFNQLQPIVPQTPADVRAGESFFVLDVSNGCQGRGSARASSNR
jgi:hypothetical protein